MVPTEALYTAMGKPVVEAQVLHKPCFNDVFILQGVISLGKALEILFPGQHFRNPDTGIRGVRTQLR